jgi:transcription-repair coupling factor (superfamily II helicase)
VLFYPGSYRRPYQIEDTDNANVLLRPKYQQNKFSQETGCNRDLSRSPFEKVVTRRDLEKKP